MSNTTSSNPARSTPTPTCHVTNPELERFFNNCGDDTRRKIFGYLGLPKRKKRPWVELWNALGLEEEQPEELWRELTTGPDGRNHLWAAARVAVEVGITADTVNGYCHKGTFPEDFPKPIIAASRKVRLWLPIEVCAYNRPSLYGCVASQIRRKTTKPNVREKPETIGSPNSSQPLPPDTQETSGNGGTPASS